MFEDNDWDFDQNFLDDIDEKAAEFYSQSESRAEVEPAKRRKVESFTDTALTNNIHNDTSTEKTGSSKNDSDAKKASRTNLILRMFNENSVKKNECEIGNTLLGKLPKNHVVNTKPMLPHNSNNDSRKNLVLGILQRRNNEVSKNQCTSSNVPETVKKNSSKIELYNNKCQELHSVQINHVKGMQESKPTNSRGNGSLLQKPSSSTRLVSEFRSIDNNGKSKIQKETNRTRLLANARKEQSINASKPSITNCTKSTTRDQGAKPQNSPVFKIPQAQPQQRTTLIRRFPGPAGLLPDDADASDNSMSYLSNLEENEDEGKSEPTDSNYSEYCSQNTKNLFTEGAWQLMLNDLPPGFLRGYEIATVKQKANTNCNRSTKIDFLAGLLEYVDHSHDNPPIVLKDFTDSVQGILHRDIPLKYPGLLEPNVVLLLRDVGLLRSSGTLLSSKYHILISPSSLIAIYSKKGKIAHTTDAFLTNHSKESSGDSVDEAIENITPNKNSDTDWYDLFKDSSELLDFDDMDTSYVVSSNEITNSQNVKNFPNQRLSETRAQKTPKKLSVNKVEQSSSEKKRESLLQALKKFAPEQNTKKMLSTSKVKQMESTSFNSNINNSGGMWNNSVKRSVEEKSQIFESRNSTTNLTEASNIQVIQSAQNANTKTAYRIRSQLLQFKNRDGVTPESETQNSKTDLISKERTEQKSDDKSCSFESMLCDTENDSDDEILSQLDVDKISENYNKQN